MATIRKTNTQKWEVQIRRKGVKAISKTFHKKSDALEWSRHMEHQADRRSLPKDTQQLDRMTLAELIDRYIDEVLPPKKGCQVETTVLEAFKRHQMARLKLSELSPAHFSSYRDERLKDLKPATVHRRLGMLQHVFEVAIKEWDIPLNANPLVSVRKPKFNNNRNRRVNDEEIALLVQHTEKCRNKQIKLILAFALHTAMRRGEIIHVQWKHVDLEKRTLLIPEAKNGQARTIPLSSQALEVLKGIKRETGVDFVFPTTIEAFKLSWKRLVDRSGIENLHFHDFRHEAITRFFEKGLSVPEVALISGHRDFRMLFRYTHLKAEDLAEKLN